MRLQLGKRVSKPNEPHVGDKEGGPWLSVQCSPRPTATRLFCVLNGCFPFVQEQIGTKSLAPNMTTLLTKVVDVVFHHSPETPAKMPSGTWSPRPLCLLPPCPSWQESVGESLSSLLTPPRSVGPTLFLKLLPEPLTH